MNITVNIISDTSGHATEHLVKKSTVQFDAKAEIKVYPFIRDLMKLETILNIILHQKNHQILYYSVQDSKMKAYIDNFCQHHKLKSVDVMSFFISQLAESLDAKPKSKYDSKSLYETDFYRKIYALDFAIKYDDGKDFRSLEDCDIALIGVSRSSKTPVSMYLASKGFRVSNIPILLGNEVPRQLYEIDNKKIFGLTLDKKILRDYRIERLKSLNIPSENSKYSDLNRIEKELAYAEEIMKDLDCKIIDITNKSIEETSDIIVNDIYKYERGKEVD
jgi:regulator of PEP synthase PpsR (kinase-PPPase family)